MAANSEPSKRYIIYILAVLLVILSAVLLYIQYNSLTELKAEEEQEQLALDTAYVQLARLSNHRENAAEYEQRLEYALKMIPAAPGEEDLLRYIYRLASDSGMLLSEIRYAGRSDTENFTIMALSLNLEGNYQDLRQFLRHLNSGERAIRVNTISISRTGAETGSRVALTASAFYNPGN
jgi:Tfp pilus assembly protein PilO